MNQFNFNAAAPQENPEWEGPRGDSLHDIQEAASRAAEGATADIAGKENIDLQMAADKINEAIKYVDRYFGHEIKDIDLKKIHFKQFSGNIVGESTDKGIDVTPEMLMHPAIRLAHLLAHEFLHRGDDVPSERLVQAYCSIHFGTEHLTQDYSEYVADFREFAGEFGENVNDQIMKIYNLYALGKYEEILDLYLDRFDRKERDNAMVRFFDIFPELEMSTGGDVVAQPVAVAEKMLKEENST